MSSIPIDQVPGLSVATALAMNAKGVFMTADLLRSDRVGLASATRQSVVEIRNFQTFAQFLEIDHVTPEIAEALMRAGIDRLDEFTQKTLGALSVALQNLTPPPSDDDIVKSLLSARRLQFTGVINGTVVTTHDAPLDGAIASAGGQTVTTDARGRFRIIGLRCEQTYTVSLSHASKRAKLFNRIAAHPSSALIGRQFRLTGRPAPLARLSAMTGDALPPLGSAPITTESRHEPLDVHDRYVLAEFYANGDGKLGSLFLDFDDGRFVVRTYRVLKADLPTGAKLNDRMVLTNGKLKRAAISPGEIGRLTRSRAVKKTYAGQTLTPALFDRAAKDLIATAREVRCQECGHAEDGTV
ncbi:MAG: carboxypeptidase-like regulatory domain-containing protein, partial [Deltaproteobacteria bacterium]